MANVEPQFEADQEARAIQERLARFHFVLQSLVPGAAILPIVTNVCSNVPDSNSSRLQPARTQPREALLASTADVNVISNTCTCDKAPV